jgi:hypothetical protein
MCIVVPCYQAQSLIPTPWCDPACKGVTSYSSQRCMTNALRCARAAPRQTLFPTPPTLNLRCDGACRGDELWQPVLYDKRAAPCAGSPGLGHVIHLHRAHYSLWLLLVQ